MNNQQPHRPQSDQALPPLLANKRYAEPSVFNAANMLREARRQKGLPAGTVPAVCLLDPDGDILTNLLRTDKARHHPSWACYHTQLYTTWLHSDPVGCAKRHPVLDPGSAACAAPSRSDDCIELGIIGGVIGASFAVLVAEELFASGCRLLISVTSAGQITPVGPPPYFVLIDRALRDEGTSYHYLPPADYSRLNAELRHLLESALADADPPVHIGATWTTDAPFRETPSAIAFAQQEGILAVEMEAAALYALAEAHGWPIICYAQVTNQMASIEGDFEKGDANGSAAALQVVAVTASLWRAGGHPPEMARR